MTNIKEADRLFFNNQLVNAVYAGSARVWPVFKPTELSGCVIWLDISKSPGITNGGDVTFLTNWGSGPAPIMIGNPPTPKFRTNALNTVMPCMRITQGQGRFRFTGTGIDKDWTLIYVGRKWNNLTTGRVVTALSTAANLLVGFHGSEFDQCYVEAWITSGTAPGQTLQWRLYSADSTSSAVARFFSDGILKASGAATPAKGWGGTLNISGYTDVADIAASQQADCEIAELVMYNRKLSDAERMQVEKYLREKWNPIQPFKPTDLGSNLVGWFDATDAATVTLAGSGVSQWINKGAGSLTLSQATDANRPFYANETVNFVNPRAFSAANCPSSYDIMLFSKPNTAATADWRTLIRSTASSPHQIIIESGTTRLGTYSGGFLPAGGLTWGNVWGIGYGRVADSAAVQLSRDGGVMTTTTTALPAGGGAFGIFGAYQGPPIVQSWGEIKEIIIVPYNSESIRPLLEGYIAHRWEMQALLPAGHPYKGAPP
jgi:hypothetical protein